MKIFTLLVTLLAFVISGYSQQQIGAFGNPPNCKLPEGYTLSQGARLITYQNPLFNCEDRCGIVTPGVGGNDPANIIFPARVPQPSGQGFAARVAFNLFAFDANLRCASNKDLECDTYVDAYIVDESYRSVQAPSSANYYGKAKVKIMARGAENIIEVPFSKAPDQNTKYRVFVDFGKGTPCIQGNTKYIIDIFAPGVLPVNLSSFLAGRIGSNVSLNWKTEIEMNTINFEVQRSFDNVNFQTIGTVASNVGGSSTKSYSYVDKSNTSKTLSFYRLKMVKQAEVVYSDIKTVKGIASKLDFTIFPNPSVGNAKITISDLSEPTRVQLLDNSGRLVKTLMLNNTNTVELMGLLKGAYMVRIIGSVTGNTEVRKLTVIN